MKIIIAAGLLVHLLGLVATGNDLLGDFDGNGKLTSADIDQLTVQVSQGTFDTQFDLNKDGLVNQLDRTVWVNELAYTYFGDANLNGVFNTGDLVHVFKSSEFEDTIVANSTWEEGDWNGDFEFDSGDLVLAFQANAFEGAPRDPLGRQNGNTTGPGVVPVPEPNGLSTLFFGFAVVVMRLRYR
ncbi:MAG: hypothetical protein R3C28_25085 [Pirellulaceae bacterium]